MSNYTISDLGQILCYLLVWCLVFTGQGFVIGQVSNVLQFRRRSTFKQLCLSTMLSLGVMPSVYYLLGLIGGLKAAIILTTALLVGLAIIFVRSKKTPFFCTRFLSECTRHRYIFLAILIWLIVGAVLIIDIQIGNKLYLSITALDYGGKVAMSDAIGRSGIPPTNPMFFPGHPVPLYYCYYWPLLCAIISTLCQSPFNTRLSVLAGILWTGCAFIALLSFCSNYFKIDSLPRRKVEIISMKLLLVSGLAILLVLPSNLKSWIEDQKLYIPDIAWWAWDQINLLASEMIWTPHHLSGLIAATLGSILILEAHKCTRQQDKVWTILLAGVCLASSFGLSAYIAVGYTVSWLVWSIVSFWQKRFLDGVYTISAMITALLVALPFLCELSHARHQLIPLALAIRKFDLIDVLMPSLLHWPRFVHHILYLICLPFNYLFGFGFILFATYMFWHFQGNRNLLASRKQLFLVVIASVGLLLGSFVRSIIRHNDFGWKIVMLPNLCFLLWSAQYLAQISIDKTRKLPIFGYALLYIGLFGGIYSLFLDRISPPIAPHTVCASRSYAWRKIYDDLDKKLPQNAIVQHNPKFDFFSSEPFFSYYSHRQAVASDNQLGTISGPIPNEYFKVAMQISNLYNNPSFEEANAICKQYKINVIVVKDTDNIWSNRAAWIYRFPIIAKNDHACAFQIQP